MYEFNVAKIVDYPHVHYSHIFSTHRMSIREEKAKSMLEFFQSKFPESEGYKVSCILWSESGRTVTF